VSAHSHSSEAKLEITNNGPWSNAWKIAAGVGALGLLGVGAGFASDPKRLAFSYLFAIMAVLVLAIGMLFFVVVQHISAAHWSVGVRRTAEFFMGGMPVLAVLFLPLFLLMQHLPQWEHFGHASDHGTAVHSGEHGQAQHGHGDAHGGEHGQPAAAHASSYELETQGLHHVHHLTLEKKRPWFDKPFFFVRQALYLLAWVWLSRRFFKLSTDQDKLKDKKITVTAARSAPAAIAIIAITLTFASFDWLMALEPAWYSTIFGVTIFAGGITAAMAALILTVLALKRAGYIGDDIVNVNHFHDMAKLMFGFNCFWAYVVFSQFFLIWYASIPEETIFYHARWNDNPAWQPVSLSLVIFHFAVPFIMLMSHNVKRRMGWLALGAGLLLVMHVVEYYWLVLPTFKAGAHGAAGAAGEGGHGSLPVHWMDFAALLGVGGAYLALVFRLMTQHKLVPVSDPRLERSKLHTTM
jgi:hypothetical protein